MAQFQLKGADQLKRALRDAGDLATTALASAMVAEMERIVREAKKRVPSNTSNLKGSGTVLPPEIKGTRITVIGGFGNSASRYAIWVHEGRKPGKMPPPDAIRRWVLDKKIDEDAVWPIARAIGRRGIKKTKFLEAPFREAVPGMAQRLGEDLERALTRLRAH